MSNVARAEVVGSLLQPEELLRARQDHRDGLISLDELHAIEDGAVLEAIALQEEIGLDVITDGEMRRRSWADTLRHLGGIELTQAPRSYPANVREMTRPSRWNSAAGAPTVTGRVRLKSDHTLGREYRLLHSHAHRRTKYTMAAPSYHRRYWSDTASAASGYSSCEEYLTDVRDCLRSVVLELIDQGCTYVQLDAPNYGSLCDPDNRAWHQQQRHNLDAEIAFDAALDSSVFEALPITGALHICRGNGPAGHWHSQGGYAAIAGQLFPSLAADVVLLEYDSDRAGDFEPLRLIPPDTIVVLGLLSTKSGELEPASAVEQYIAEATKARPLESLALSTQCGFASAANAPMDAGQQRAKLARVVEVARQVWG